MDYGKAINYIIARRSNELAAAETFFRELMSSSEEFRSIELSVRAAELSFARGLVERTQLDSLYAQRAAIVNSLGAKDKLSPPPHCNKCNDTGRKPSGEYCDCVKRLAFSQKSDNIELPFHSFDEIKPELFDEKGREVFTKAAADLQAIAQKSDAAKRKNINLVGSSGTGKTFLASCFAEASSAIGRTVVFITAFSFVERALAYHTTFDASKSEHLMPLIESDVLIIDDLGTESIFKNVTLEYLYHVINERQLKGKTTFITSNLTINEFAARYGERIASRLFDKRLCYTREFVYTDVRKIKI